mmetsp:Transcript_6887/g.17235  ORF Transcript_6887/g.17235 Transcript_6887/m.17235 type:complete len:230 (-) Transcript_6887:46-735(-)
MVNEGLADKRQAQGQPQIVQALCLDLFELHDPTTSVLERRVLPGRRHAVLEERVIDVFKLGRRVGVMEHTPEILRGAEFVDQSLAITPCHTLLRSGSLVDPEAPPVLELMLRSRRRRHLQRTSTSTALSRLVTVCFAMVGLGSRGGLLRRRVCGLAVGMCLQHHVGLPGGEPRADARPRGEAQGTRGWRRARLRGVAQEDPRSHATRLHTSRRRAKGLSFRATSATAQT